MYCNYQLKIKYLFFLSCICIEATCCMSSSVAVHFLTFLSDKVPHWFGLTDCPASLRDPLCLPSTGIMDVSGFLNRYQGWNLGLHVCVASALPTESCPQFYIFIVFYMNVSLFSYFWSHFSHISLNCK